MLTGALLLQLVSFRPLYLFGRWCTLVQQIGPRTAGNTSILQHLFKLAWQQIRGADLVKKCCLFCRRSNVLKSYTIQSRVVDTPRKTTKSSIMSSLVCKNPSWSNPIFRSNVVQTVSFLSERATCTQVHPSEIQRVFDWGFVRVPGFFGGHVFAKKICCDFSASHFVFHRDGIGAVIGLCAPNKSSVCKRPLKRTATCDSVKFTVYARHT